MKTLGLRKKCNCFLFLSIFFFISCHYGVPKDVERALKMAKNNRTHLEKVLDHYQAPKDSLKLEAAYFLIQNMYARYSLEGERLERYNSLFDEIKGISDIKPFDYANRINGKFPEVDSLWKEFSIKEGLLNRWQLEVKPDLEHISSDFLIKNIDLAFKAWEFPWSKHLNFDEFCEYILPYRFGDETLINWRTLVLNMYMPLLDSLWQVQDPIAICDTINKRLTQSWKYSHVLTQYPVTMTIDNMTKGKMGSCTHQAALGIFTMRALGVPVVREEVPHYGNRSLGHDFNAVLGKNGTFLNFEVGNKNLGNVIETRNRWNFLIPKIYRHTFSINKESLSAKISTNQKVPPYFLNPYIKDVTAQYIPVADVEVSLKSPMKSTNTDFVYLCIFDNKEWRAISWTNTTGNKAVFKDMGKGFVYMPMYYDSNGFIPAGPPFILDKNGEKKTINPSSKTSKMVLERKYAPAEWFNHLMVDGKFQGSNDINFKHLVNLHVVKDTLEAAVPHEIHLECRKNFRYVRYLLPKNSVGNIAEMKFISKDDDTLTGKVISSNNIDPNVNLGKVFDNNPLSFLDTKTKVDGQWVGLDFGSPKKISKISFCPRTDKNNVWAGLHYELFYWDDGWKSLGAKKAVGYNLVYDTPVSNTLYLLKCLDGGKEERIFTYENDKQLWW